MPDVTRRSDLIRQLLDERRPLRFLEAHSGISALIVENTKIQQGERTVEYDGIWVSSLTDSGSKGIPDAEILGPESRCALVAEIANVTTKPVIVDADTGGSFAQFQYFVKNIERAGASGLVVEDKVFPKLNSLDPDAVQKLEDPRIFSQKIQVGKSARMSANFMIVARLESLTIGTGLEDALTRSKAFIEAGADGIMIHSRSRNADEILEFARRYERLCAQIGRRPPLVCVPTTYNSITDDELGKVGFQIIIHANQMLRSSYKTMKETAESILLNDRGFEADTLCAPVSEIFRAVGFYELKDQDARAAKLRNLAVIIPAARKDPIFRDVPKSLISIAGKTILDHQLEVLRSIGLRRIVVIRGYEGNQIKRDDITLLNNKNYEDRHSLHSLFVAREHMHGGFLLVFSDILFNEEIVKRLLDCDADIVLAVDNSYRFHKKDITKELDLVVSRQPSSAFQRTLTPTRIIDIRQIGKKIAKELADNEFVGIAYFSPEVADTLPLIYEDCENVEGTIS